LGGFAAPLFLWLAGISLVLSAARMTGREHDRARAVNAVCRRGLEIFILAFAFRLQAFVLTPGSYLVTLFRVDILNIMGPAIVAAALVWAVGRSTGRIVVLYAAIATTIAMVTPVVRTATFVNALPTLMQWYIRPSGDQTNFTVFPWAAFVFAGAAVGAVLAVTDGQGAERRCHRAIAGIGVLLVVGGLAT